MAVRITDLYRHMEGDGIALYAFCRQGASRDTAVKEGVKEWLPDLHDVTRKSLRPDKIVYVPDGTFTEDGKPNYVTDTQPKSRAPLALQKYIINQKAGFSRGNGVILKSNLDDSKLYDQVYRNWYDNKTDFHLTEIFRRIMAETQCAVIFYGDKEDGESVEDFRFRFKIVSPLLGDKLEPIYDEDTDDLIAFGREYKRGKKTRYDLYVINEQKKVEIRRFEDGKPRMTIGTVSMVDINGVMQDVEGEVYDIIQTPYTKLPVILGEQDLPECYDTRDLIAEFEKSFNDFLDQMGYSADPILFGKGTTMDLPSKSQAGKYMEGSADSDLKFVTPENATESRNLQFKMLREFIMTLNGSIWLDLETMKNLGATSGAALERYLLTAYMEATGKQQGYLGIFVQRMMNWMLHEWRSLMGGIDKGLRIDVVFDKYSLRDKEEDTELAMKANGGKPVVDHATSIAMAGLVDDVDKTKALIDKETATPEPEPVTE